MVVDGIYREMMWLRGFGHGLGGGLGEGRVMWRVLDWGECEWSVLYRWREGGWDCGLNLEGVVWGGGCVMMEVRDSRWCRIFEIVENRCEGLRCLRDRL
jgi:hypothetical protein